MQHRLIAAVLTLVMALGGLVGIPASPAAADHGSNASPSGPPVGPFTVPFLKTSGDKIVKVGGSTTDISERLKGANFGVVEWMVGGGWPEARAYDLRFSQELENWRGNTATVGVAWGEVNARNPEYLKYLDFHMHEAKDMRRYVILAARSQTINGELDANFSTGARDALGFLAKRYANNPHVIFATAVEPHTTNSTDPNVAQWKWNEPGGFEEVQEGYVDVIRWNAALGGATHEPIVMAAGDNYGRMIDPAVSNPLDRSNIVYKAHVYIPVSMFDTYFGDLVKQAQVPVWFGEIGPESDLSPQVSVADVQATIWYAGQHGIGWNAWMAGHQGEPHLMARCPNTSEPWPWNRTSPCLQPAQHATGPYGQNIKDHLATIVDTPQP